MQNNLHVKDLQVCVGRKKNQHTLINNFNYEFKPGLVYYIVGPSGVGKTTLVSHFNGLIKSNHGDIFIKDKAIFGNKRKIKDVKEIRKAIQLVFQFSEQQIFKSTVIKDVAYGPINFGLTKDKAIAQAKKYLNELGIDASLYNESPFVLSNGQRKKVAMAGILAINPDIYIFDEPTVGLDPTSQAYIIKLINKLKSLNKTIIVVSHNTDNALALADQVLLLFNKQLLAAGTAYEVLGDKQLMESTGCKIPDIINTINLLNTKSSKYISLYKLQPKTINELALYINRLMKGGK